MWSLIPQVFYDVIGRVVPGAAVCLAAVLLSPKCGDLAKQMNALLEQGGDSWISGASVALVLSYVVGTLLGGLGLALETWWRLLWGREDSWSRAYRYDAIQHFMPASGQRLAKLRGEQHFCWVIAVGSVLLAVAAIGEGNCHAALCCVAATICSGLFYWHLSQRTDRLTANAFTICESLDEYRPRPAAGARTSPSSQAEPEVSDPSAPSSV